MGHTFSNGRRRLIGALLALGVAGPGAVRQAAAQSAQTDLPDCSRGKFSDSREFVGERYEARIYTDYERCTAVVPMKRTVNVPGFDRGRFGIRLAADTEKGAARLLRLRLDGVRDEAKDMVGLMRFALLINGRRVTGITAPSAGRTFVSFADARGSLPRTFFQLSHDIEVDVYLPGTPTSGAPTYRLAYDKDRIAAGTRLAQAEMAQLRQTYAAGSCKPVIPRVCFLTTAAVDMLGLPDDCWELATLRTFRDGWLAKQPGGAEQIAEYYARAPAIAARLAEDPQRLSRLYLSHILPSAIAAGLGCNRAARALYVGMMRKVADLG